MTEPTGAIRVNIIASFTALPIVPTIEFWATQLGIHVEVSVAPYAQVFAGLQRLDPGHAPTAAAVLIRMEDFIPPSGESGAMSVADELGAAIIAAAERVPATTLLLAVCPASPSVLADPARDRAISDATALLRRRTELIANLKQVFFEDVVVRHAVGRVANEYSDKVASIPYTLEYFAALGTALVRVLHRELSSEPKVIVVDGDNTLWDGVLGEDGPSAIRLDSARQDLQEFLLDQRRAGRLLCLCTKNALDDVTDVFTAVPLMRLAIDDFVRVRTSWQPKSTILSELADDLGLDLGSFVFIDDSPLECEEVRLKCPEVTVLELPANSSDALSFLQHFWPLDIGKINAEAAQRTDRYQQEQRRNTLRQRWTGSMSDFIASLGLEVTVRPSRPADYARIAELTRRTTQFNLTGQRYAETELASLPNWLEQLVVEAADRFGQYGTVGVIQYSAANGILTVTNMLLSCRALGRGVEHRMLTELARIAAERRLNVIELQYVATARNHPAGQFLGEVATLADERYTIAVHDAMTVRFDPDRTLRETAIQISTARSERSAPRWSAIASLTTAEAIRKAVVGRPDDGFEVPPSMPDDERTVRQVWAEILKVSLCQTDLDFSSLGGDSLQLVELQARLFEEFEVELPVNVLLDDHLTVNDVVATIRALGTGGAVPVPWME